MAIYNVRKTHCSRIRVRACALFHHFSPCVRLSERRASLHFIIFGMLYVCADVSSRTFVSGSGICAIIMIEGFIFTSSASAPLSHHGSLRPCIQISSPFYQLYAVTQHNYCPNGMIHFNTYCTRWAPPRTHVRFGFASPVREPAEVEAEKK
jgi:hypothetical protein